jgi:hypothetical protein
MDLSDMHAAMFGVEERIALVGWAAANSMYENDGIGNFYCVMLNNDGNVQWSVGFPGIFNNFGDYPILGRVR